MQRLRGEGVRGPERFAIKADAYRDLPPFTEEEIDLGRLEKPKFCVMLNIGDPDNASRYSYIPVDGVGLRRIEFIVSSYIRVHPLGLIHLDTLWFQPERSYLGYADRDLRGVKKINAL